MDEVLVVKAVKPNYNTLSGGPPIMMVGGGGGGGRGGRTWREAIGGKVGGLVGVAGALAGQHRSLGSLAQSMISGGAQGAALGGGLGRRLVGRRGQALADLKEKEKQENAQLAAEHVKEFGASGSNKNLAAQRRSYLTGVQNREQQAAQQAKIDRARQRAQARAEGREFGDENRQFAQSYRDMRENLQGLSEENKNQVFNDLNQAFKNYGNTSRVDPSTQGSGDVAVVNAAGENMGSAQQMIGVTNNIPPVPQGAPAETLQGIQAGNRQAMGTGTDHDGEYGETITQPSGNSPTLNDIQQENQEEQGTVLDEKQQQAMEMFRQVQDRKERRFKMVME